MILWRLITSVIVFACLKLPRRQFASHVIPVCACVIATSFIMRAKIFGFLGLGNEGFVRVFLLWEKHVRNLTMSGVITKKLSFDLKGRSEKKDNKCNGNITPTLETNENQTEKNDSNSERSSITDRKIVRRSSLICSSGKDKFTFDSEHADVPVRSVDRELNSRYLPRSVSDLSSRASLIGSYQSDQASSFGNDGESSPVCKRDSVVHPGYDPKSDLQRSLCIDGRFQNPWPTWKQNSFTSLLKFGLSRSKSNLPTKVELDKALPIVKPDFDLLAKPPSDGIRVTWLGHATALIQFDGVTMITDPMFSDRASPSQMVGPKRYREPPCTVNELPHINAVLISHTHYDHLDLNSVTLLNARFGAELRWYVPCGLTNWLRQLSVENVIELDWWEESLVPDIPTDVCVVFTPAQHWCKRTMNDDNKVLWGSWCVIGPRYKFFFAGDTGYCDAFKQIGRMFGPFDLSAIPIGAYEPRWFMKYAHVNPEDAVKIHLDVRSKRSLAIHWGTFALANEYYLEPPIKLREALDDAGIPINHFFTLNHGETKLLGVIENNNGPVVSNSSLSLTSNEPIRKTPEK